MIDVYIRNPEQLESFAVLIPTLPALFGRMAADLPDRVVPAAALRIRQPTRRSKLRDYGKPDAGQYELPADHSTLVVCPQLLRTDGAAQ